MQVICHSTRGHNRSKNKNCYTLIFSCMLYSFIGMTPLKHFCYFQTSTMTALVHKLQFFVCLFFQNEGIIMLSFFFLGVQLLYNVLCFLYKEVYPIHISLPSQTCLPHPHHPPHTITPIQVITEHPADLLCILSQQFSDPLLKSQNSVSGESLFNRVDIQFCTDLQ